MTITAAPTCEYPGCTETLLARPGRGGSAQRWCEIHRHVGKASRRAGAPRPNRKRYPRKKTKKAPVIRPWCGIDTEGVTDTEGRWGPVGRHYPMVVTAAAPDGFERWLYRGRPLQTGEIIKWLIWALPRKTYKYCGFFFGYDQSMILHTVPEKILAELYKADEKFTQVTPPQTAIAGPYVIDRFSTKITFVQTNPRLTELPLDEDARPDLHQVRGPRIEIWDVGKFYSQGFAKVLSNYPDLVGADERLLVEEMKAERADFDPAYWDRHAQKIIRYSLTENRLLARIQNRFDANSAAQGYQLTSWYGAGSLAKSMLKAEGVLSHLEASPAIPVEMREAVDWSYFGGRFEIQGPGVIEAEVWEHDITSAYPASYRDLPCRIHGEWRLFATRRKVISSNDLCFVKWNITGSRFGPFPVRDRHHRVCYPWAGEGWFWGHEVGPAVELWGRRAISVRQTWQHQPACECPPPLAWISGPYERRRALGKAAAGYPLKIGMNAVYGSVVSPLVKACWEPVWGSMITSYCRGRLIEAMALAPSLDDVLMLATDAIYTTGRLPLPEGPNLGEWEIKNVGPGGILIQPGLYHFPGGETSEAKFKSRGINQQDVVDNIGRFYETWARDGWTGTVSVPLRPRFIGARAGLARGKLEDVAWRWTEHETRDISFNPTLKRLQTQFGWMPPWPIVNPQPYIRFMATWEPERFKVPESMPVDLLEIDQPEGPVM